MLIVSLAACALLLSRRVVGAACVAFMGGHLFSGYNNRRISSSCNSNRIDPIRDGLSFLPLDPFSVSINILWNSLYRTIHSSTRYWSHLFYYHGLLLTYISKALFHFDHAI